MASSSVVVWVGLTVNKCWVSLPCWDPSVWESSTRPASLPRITKITLWVVTGKRDWNPTQRDCYKSSILGKKQACFFITVLMLPEAGGGNSNPGQQPTSATWGIRKTPSTSQQKGNWGTPRQFAAHQTASPTIGYVSPKSVPGKWNPIDCWFKLCLDT